MEVVIVATTPVAAPVAPDTAAPPLVDTAPPAPRAPGAPAPPTPVPPRESPEFPLTRNLKVKLLGLLSNQTI